MALFHANYFSEALGMNAQVDVILPDPRAGQAARAPYPTLYLLHGMCGDQTDWQRKSSIERYASEYELAVVMPSAHLGWYADTNYGMNYFTFVARELPCACRFFFANLSPRREDTLVAGLSMGGYGALKCALRAGDVFSRAASLSGAVDILDVCAAPPELRPPHIEKILGPAEAVRGSFDDLFAAAEALPSAERPALYMWCGKQDFLYHQNVAMRDHLRALRYDLTYEESDGDHQWQYWDEKIQSVLKWLPLKKRGEDAR